MKNKKGKLKGFIKNAFKTTLEVALIFSACLGGKATYTAVKTKNYASNEQIEEVAKELNCDLSYMNTRFFNKILVLNHNGDKPIYVSIDNDFTSDEKKDIVFTLDHVFKLVNDINPNYRYELVDENEMPKNIFTTTIKYELDKEDNNSSNYLALASSTNKNLLYSQLVQPAINSSVIIYDREKTENNKANRIVVFTHELLHVFGFKDVYFEKINANYYHSLLNIINNSKDFYTSDNFAVISPNDYRCLISVYAEKFKNKEEKNKFLENFKIKTKEYDSLYYGIYKEANNLKGLDIYDNIIFKGTYIYTKYEIVIKNNQYSFALLDENGNILDKCNGEAISVDGVLFLKNVKLEKGFLSNVDGAYTIVDLILSKKQNFTLLSSVNAKFSATGLVKNLENMENTNVYKKNNIENELSF